jgi:hypothetical protein
MNRGRRFGETVLPFLRPRGNPGGNGGGERMTAAVDRAGDDRRHGWAAPGRPSRGGDRHFHRQPDSWAKAMPSSPSRATSSTGMISPAPRANGAALLVVSESKLPALGRLTAPMIVVKDVLAALEHLGRGARARSKAQDHRGDGFGGQDDEQGNAAPCARTHRRGSRLCGLVQQSLGRAADAGADAADTPNSACSRSA